VNTCSHLAELADVDPTPNTTGCESCLALGWTWVHLRLCLACGQVGCCDSSRGKHASGHYRAIGHPVVRSLEPDEDWAWCFVDEMVG
jgi:uncharacterized UBP type Zn finger protein